MLDRDDLKPVTVASLQWQVSSPHYDSVVFDERGMPFRAQTVDPRAFILHKWYASRQPDRSPMKRSRDEDQARLMATLLRDELNDRPATQAIHRIFPHTIRQSAVQGLDDVDL